MARIRSRHPGIMTDENYVAMSFAARLALDGLGHEADDAGVFEWKPVGLKMRLFPADAVDMAELLSELERNGWLLRYEVDGRVYGAIRNFCRWQRPKRPSYKLPRSSEVNQWVEFQTKSEQEAVEAAPVPTKGGMSPQMEEVGGKPSLPSVEREARTPSMAGTLGLPREQPYPGYDLDAAQAGLSGDLGPVWAAFVEHHHAEGKLIASMPHAWRRWCRREIGFRQRGAGPPANGKPRGPSVDDMLNRI